MMTLDSRAHRRAMAWGLFVFGALAACSGSGPGAPAADALPTGAIGLHPSASPAAPTYFVAEDPSPGDASSLKLLDVFWGRLVEIHDRDSATPLFSQFVINGDLLGDGARYVLERDPLTDTERVRILFERSTPQFLEVLRQLEASRQVLLKKGLSPSELPPFSAAARNCALVLEFNDLLDHETIDSQSLRLTVGYPPITPFDARVFADPSHGNLRGGRFHSTRVIVDFTVSEVDAQSTSLALNPLGLPAAAVTTSPNALLRIPTRVHASSQQLGILRAAGGRALDFNGNGPVDPLASTLDVLRAFRSGGNSSVTGDVNNGFLLDHSPPQVVGRQTVALLNTLDFSTSAEQAAFLRFGTAACAFTPRAGDVLDIGAVRLRVTGGSGANPTNAVVGPVLLRQLCENCEPAHIPVNTNNPPLGSLRAPYRPQPGSGPDYPACFVEIAPPPLAPPAAGISPDATFTVAFSEPMDPTSVRPFDSLLLSYGNNAPSTSPLYSDVVARVAPSGDNRRFTLQPLTPLRRVRPGGAADGYTLSVSAGQLPATDLSGNSVAGGLPPIALALSTQGATIDSGGVRLRFDSGDEDADGAPEVRGQILYDVVRQAVKPRAVQRFSASVDPSVPVVAAMRDMPLLNIQTPLSNWGSRLMRVWRYCDVGGMGLRDEATHNVDLEGLWWQPFGGALQVDSFSQFQIGVAHSRFLPDESVNLGLPQHPESGLVQTYNDNLLDPVSDPLTIVAPKARGYSVNPSDVSLSTSGAAIAPFPINRGVAPSEFVYWTWRDTAKTAVGAPNGVGADPARLTSIIASAAEKGFYPVDRVPTIGLPLLTDIRTYPDSQASGQNAFRIAIALNSSARPFFRVFTTGGVPPGASVGTPVHPDALTQAEGSISPSSGALLPWGDNTVYYGQADFVVRISRMHTTWFDTFDSATRFVDALVEPGAEQLPSGTQIVVAYRGASSFAPAPPPGQTPQHDARNFDAYGNLYTAAQLNFVFPGGGGGFATAPLFHPAPDVDRWSSSAAQLDGARFIQARVSFLSNPTTGLSPELSALGLAYFR